MSLFRGIFKKKTDHFISYLIRQSELVVEGLDALKDFMEEPTRENAKRVNIAEEHADEVRRMLIDELNRTFVTPIDREDLYTLSRAIDDQLDYALTTVDEMETLEIKPNDTLKRMSGLLQEAASELFLAMQRLEEHPNVASEHCRRAKKLENRIEADYRKAIAELFAGEATPENIICMLKQREILRHISNAADRADEAANIISNIIVKMT